MYLRLACCLPQGSLIAVPICAREFASWKCLSLATWQFCICKSAFGQPGMLAILAMLQACDLACFAAGQLVGGQPGQFADRQFADRQFCMVQLVSCLHVLYVCRFCIFTLLHVRIFCMFVCFILLHFCMFVCLYVLYFCTFTCLHFWYVCRCCTFALLHVCIFVCLYVCRLLKVSSV